MGEEKPVIGLRQSPSEAGGLGWMLAIGIAAILYGIFAMTTGRIVGNGGDGISYAHMARAFDPTRLPEMPPIDGTHNRRYLPSVLAHYVHREPTIAFTILNVPAILGTVIAFYGMLRFYALPVNWALLGLTWYLVTWPGLRFWIYYPVLTDQLATALMLGGLWAILTRRHPLYMLLASALMATRENGGLLLLFFALFHANRRNPNREPGAPSGVRTRRLAAWSVPPLLVLVQAQFWPLFPAADYSSMGFAALRAGLRDLLTSSGYKVRLLAGALNSFGAIPYVLAASAPRLDAGRVVRVARANIHWVAYIVASVLPVLLFNSDHERHFLPIVPPLLIVVMLCLRAVKPPPLRWALAGALTTAHAYLANAFAPLVTNADYGRLWGFVASESILRRHLVVAVIAAGAVFMVALTRTRGWAAHGHRVSI